MESRQKSAIVITTINPPTRAIQSIASRMGDSWHVIVVADRKTPAGWWQDGVDLLSLERQVVELPALSSATPFDHYARKNLGYVYAVRSGAACVAETDDDNVPGDTFFTAPSLMVSGVCALDRGWVNAYTHFSDSRIWPRGFPLPRINGSLEGVLKVAAAADTPCPIQQFLADGDPDVDAIYRLTNVGEVLFRQGSLILPPGSVCPFNSQNTLWWPDAFLLMYLPSYATFRMTDIWRSLVAEACLAAVGSAFAFHGPTVYQERNPHDLLVDFEQELPGYLSNEALVTLLQSTELSADPSAQAANVWACYEALVAGKFLPADELPLVQLWLREMSSGIGAGR